jgi:hypothetical protein
MWRITKRKVNGMNANECPICGKEVMPYRRFIREAEPWKTSLCGSCGAKLRRSPKVFRFLLLMMLPLAVVGIALFFWLTTMRLGYWANLTALLLLASVWTVLTNYLAWRHIGWVPAKEENK